MIEPAPASSEASPIVGLEYAPAPRTSQVWYRRVRRWLIRGLIGVTVIGAIRYGPRVWSHWELLRLQARCTEPSVPAGVTVYESNETLAQALLDRGTGEYQRSTVGVVRPDPRWAALEAKLEMPVWRDSYSGPWATVFMGERTSPAGHRRLIVVEYRDGTRPPDPNNDGLETHTDSKITVIEPGSPFVAPRVVWTSSDRYRGRMGLHRIPDNLRVIRGEPVSGDASSFSVKLNFFFNVWAEWECKLMDDDEARIAFKFAD